ncbi:hypothetical protein C8J56DRAFT_909746 [Mycena floridula]|nr:hypothetical protein C8J56DRAFT_909746 [Mycena floridula]
MDAFQTPNETVPPLDPSLYILEGDALDFFKAQTRLEDEEELKEHILAIQRKANEIHNFPFIYTLSFTQPTISQNAAYERILDLGRTRDDAIFLDLGCCFGTDARRLAFDGFPAENMVCSDLFPDFWALGHELFRQSFPASFLSGDLFDHNFIAHDAPWYSVPPNEAPTLGALKSLTPLQGHVSVINMARLFHLFDQEQQLELARQAASLLSPLPGSTICGVHITGFNRIHRYFQNAFQHSPESWTELWDGIVFDKGSVKVVTETKILPNEDGRYATTERNNVCLWWSVTRI